MDNVNVNVGNVNGNATKQKRRSKKCTYRYNRIRNASNMKTETVRNLITESNNSYRSLAGSKKKKRWKNKNKSHNRVMHTPQLTYKKDETIVISDSDIEIIEHIQTSKLPICISGSNKNVCSISNEAIVKNSDENIMLQMKSKYEKVDNPKNKTGDDNAYCINSEPNDLVINISQPLSVDKITKAICTSDANEKIQNNNWLKAENSTTNSTPRNYTIDQYSTNTTPFNSDNCKYPPLWTPDMIKYYSNITKVEKNFDLDKIFRCFKQTSTPADWRISDADLYFKPKRMNRHSTRCHKCKEFGHHAGDCPKVDVCSMCGTVGHLYDHCPRAMCLTCGSPQSAYIELCEKCIKMAMENVPCELCGAPYHKSEECPSKAIMDFYINRNLPLYCPRNKSCYNCGNQGHFGYECPMESGSRFPIFDKLASLRTPSSVTTNEAAVASCNVGNVVHSSQVIFLTKETSLQLLTKKGHSFMNRLAQNNRGSSINLYHGSRDYIKLSGTLNQMKAVWRDLQKWSLSYNENISIPS